jgi:hypothetical protein
MDANDCYALLEHLSTSAASSHDNLDAPWSLHFDRDGTEDVAIICDAAGHDLVTSRHFWLPEGDDPIPPTLAAMRLMTAAPKLLAALESVMVYAVCDAVSLDSQDSPEAEAEAEKARKSTEAALAAIAEATASGQDGGRP